MGVFDRSWNVSRASAAQAAPLRLVTIPPMPTAPDPAPTSLPPPDPSPRPGRAVPTAVGVVAVLGLLFGALGTVWKPLALVSVLTAPAAVEAADGAVAPGGAGVVGDARVDSVAASQRAAFMLLSAAGIVTSAVLLASSFGAMGLKPWGRWGMLAYAALAIGLVVTQFALAPSAGSAGRSAAMLLYPAAVAWVFGRRGYAWPRRAA